MVDLFRAYPTTWFVGGNERIQFQCTAPNPQAHVLVDGESLKFDGRGISIDALSLLKPDGEHQKTRQRASQAHFWRVLGQMRIIAAVMTAPPMSHSRAACARLAIGAITAIPITMTRSPIIASSNLAVLPPRATPGRGDSVSRCDQQHS
jgi:hypothetical protein